MLTSHHASFLISDVKVVYYWPQLFHFESVSRAQRQYKPSVWYSSGLQIIFLP